MSHLYLGGVAFGVTLLVASFLLGGKDVHAGAHVDSAPGLGWAPIGSLRFWVFLCTFGGGAGYALTVLGSSELEAGVGAIASHGCGSRVTLAVGIMQSQAHVVERVERHRQRQDLRSWARPARCCLPIAAGKPGKVPRRDQRPHRRFRRVSRCRRRCAELAGWVVERADRGRTAGLQRVARSGKHEL